MVIVMFVGWRAGLKKVSLTELLQHRTHLSLKEAKDSVDKLLDGQQISISCSSLTEADELVKAATALGAECKIMST